LVFKTSTSPAPHAPPEFFRTRIGSILPRIIPPGPWYRAKANPGALYRLARATSVRYRFQIARCVNLAPELTEAFYFKYFKIYFLQKTLKHIHI
jgi:hypothetical protein